MAHKKEEEKIGLRQRGRRPARAKRYGRGNVCEDLGLCQFSMVPGRRSALVPNISRIWVFANFTRFRRVEALINRRDSVSLQ